MNKTRRVRWGVTLLPLALLGCASEALLIGEIPSDPPPQIVYLGARDAKGQEYMTWENVSSFGRVPEQLQAVGDLSCMRNGLALRATGFHPNARDLRGQAVPGGGFFCQLALIKGAQDSQPPRAVLKDGVLGWDRPGAFGPVPEARRLQAEQECSKGGVKAIPLGFHPRPLDVSGQPMVQGGYLCIQ